MARRRPLVALGVGLMGWTLLAGQLGLTSAHGGEGPLKGTRDALSDPPPQDFGAPLQTTSAGTRHSEAPPIGHLDYLSPDLGAPEALEAGGMRGRTPARDGLPEVLVLAPLKLARTLSDQPTLYWYLSGPSTAPLRLTVLDVDSASTEPLLEAYLGSAPSAGIYAASLAEHDVHLQKGHRYEWSVALEVNSEAYAEEPVAKTVMTVDPADPALLAKIVDAPALARVQALAGAGYWYDALDLLTQRIVANDASAPWRELRAALLEQVGLETVAAFARNGAQ